MRKKRTPAISYKIKMYGFVIGITELQPMTKAEREVVKRSIAASYEINTRFITLEKIKPCKQ